MFSSAVLRVSVSYVEVGNMWHSLVTQYKDNTNKMDWKCTISAITRENENYTNIVKRNMTHKYSL